MADMQVVLNELEESIRDSAVEAVESLLGVESSPLDDWAVYERLSGNYDHIITLGCSNSDYQGVVMFAVDDPDARHFCDSEEEINDLFGEIANTFTGVLMDKKNVSGTFGFLAQAIPMYAAKQAFFPRAWAVKGSVKAGNSVVHMGFAIRGFMSLLNR